MRAPIKVSTPKPPRLSYVKLVADRELPPDYRHKAILRSPSKDGSSAPILGLFWFYDPSNVAALDEACDLAMLASAEIKRRFRIATTISIYFSPKQIDLMWRDPREQAA